VRIGPQVRDRSRRRRADRSAVGSVAVAAVAALVSSALVATVLAPPAASAGSDRFVDVVPDGFYDAAVGWAVERGITTGVGGSDRFEPDRTVTRAEGVTFLWRYAGSPAATGPRFSDVPAGVYFDVATRWARQQGVTTGVGGSDRFEPASPLTREQWVTMLHRLAGRPDPGQPSRFVDVEPTRFSYAAVAWADRWRITTGIGGSDRFAPVDPNTRAQAVTMLHRYELTPGSRTPAPQPPAPAPDPAPDPDPAQPTARLTRVATASFPIAGAARGDDLYIAERAGTVRILRAGVLGPPVLDLSAQISDTGEGGLLGLAVSPGGSWIYLSYTDTDGTSQLERRSIGGDGSIGTSPIPLASVDQPAANHNGGHVAIGPDGRVYWGLGDGGGANDPHRNGQDTTTPLGAILRMDANGGPVTGNPFLGGPGDDRIWVYGLRNPWRFSFDRSGGDLWIADVGQSLREEVTRIPAGQGGANLGWRCFEGSLRVATSGPDCDSPFAHTGPVFEYAHDPGCSITGGHRYRGSRIAGLGGAYVYSDFCDGTIRALEVDGTGRVLGTWSLDTSAGRTISFVEDSRGELWVLAMDGAVSRLDPR
jgi:glucose/arabinose dehydrogenase